MLDVVNPYESPRAITGAVWPIPSNLDQPIVAALVSQGWLYRCVRLGGGLEAILEWNGRGPIETVRLNGTKTASKTPFWYAPNFTFKFNATSSSHRVVIDVRLSLLLPVLVRAFCIQIDGRVVYSEGKWSELRLPTQIIR